MPEFRRLIDASESDFNARLRSIVACGRRLSEEVERFLEHHGTDCRCDVCSKRSGANTTPAELCADVRFLGDFLQRTIPDLADSVIVAPTPSLHHPLLEAGEDCSAS